MEWNPVIASETAVLPMKTAWPPRGILSFSLWDAIGMAVFPYENTTAMSKLDRVLPMKNASPGSAIRA
jgi:hypothetical protein